MPCHQVFWVGLPVRKASSLDFELQGAVYEQPSRPCSAWKWSFLPLAARRSCCSAPLRHKEELSAAVQAGDPEARPGLPESFESHIWYFDWTVFVRLEIWVQVHT